MVLAASALALSGSMPAAGPPNPHGVDGTACAKAGRMRTAGGSTLVCSNTSAGLVWRARASKSPKGSTSTNWAKRGSCQTNNIWVDPPAKSTRGAFTHRPLNLDDIKIIINGADGGGADPRLAYVTIASPDRLIPIYAPAPMLLVKIRPKDTASVPNQFAMRATDWDLTFVVACNTQVRINHVTEPSQRVRDAWGYPGLFATWWRPDGTQVSSEERQVPVKEVRFKPGDIIGYTQGTALASNFDYVVAVNDVSVRP